MKSAYTLGLLIALAAVLPAQAQDCKAPLTSPAAKAASAERIARFLGNASRESPMAKSLLANQDTVWKCSGKNHNPCCKKIPVKVWAEPTGECYVELQYAELHISPTDPPPSGKVTWELELDPSAGPLVFPEGFAFDDKGGIKLLKKPGVRLPVNGGGHDGADKKFKWVTTGVRGDHAGHVPRVYPLRRPNQPDWDRECTFYDPLITNTD